VGIYTVMLQSKTELYALTTDLQETLFLDGFLTLICAARLFITSKVFCKEDSYMFKLYV